MSENSNYLETFPQWLGSLGSDAEELASLLSFTGVDEGSRQTVAGGLNYLFKSLDLIPDGIDDIGYLDDAFVLRVAADLISSESMGEADDQTVDAINRLANDCEVIRAFLNGEYDRLENYVKGLTSGTARGRSVSDILGEDTVREEFVSDVKGFSSNYEAPSFSKEEKTLLKLRAFFEYKLPKRRDSVLP